MSNNKMFILTILALGIVVVGAYIIVIFYLQFVDGGEIDFDTVGSKDETTLNLIANNDDYSSAQIALVA